MGKVVLNTHISGEAGVIRFAEYQLSLVSGGEFDWIFPTFINHPLGRMYP